MECAWLIRSLLIRVDNFDAIKIDTAIIGQDYITINSDSTSISYRISTTCLSKICSCCWSYILGSKRTSSFILTCLTLYLHNITSLQARNSKTQHLVQGNATILDINTNRIISCSRKQQAISIIEHCTISFQF